MSDPSAVPTPVTPTTAAEVTEVAVTTSATPTGGAPAAPAPVDTTGGAGPMAAVEALVDEQAPAEEKDTRPVLTVREIDFHISDEIPAFVQVMMAAAADPRTSGPKQMTAILAFLNAIVVDEERDAFVDHLENCRPVIDFKEFEKLMTDATEVLNGRPTSQ